MIYQIVPIQSNTFVDDDPLREEDDSNTSDPNRNGPLPTPAAQRRQENLGGGNGPGGNGGIPAAVAVPIPESREHLTYK